MKTTLTCGKAYVFCNAAHDDDSSYVFERLDEDGNGVFTELRHDWTDGREEEIGTIRFDEYKMSLLVPAPRIETQHWYLIEDCTSRRSAVYDEILDADTKEKALEIATAKWEALTEQDRRDRDEAYIGYAEEDEDGCVDYDTMTDIVYLKERR